MIRALQGSLITGCYIVPGLPHPLLAADQNAGWQRLNEAMGVVREEIHNSDAEMILYFSTQWLTVLGYLFQADPNPKWTLVDSNWHEFGSMPYEFKVDAEFARHYASEVKAMGHYTREVNYRGFPIDTGTVVAQKLLNPTNRLPAAMASCNMYAEKQETLSIGQAAMRAIEKHGKRVAVVCITGLSSRYHTEDIPYAEDRFSSSKDDEWNRKILEIFGEGRLEDVSEVAREYSVQANADMGFRGIWWLNGLAGKTNDFSGRVFGYETIYGTGAGVVGLYPKRPLRSVPGWVNDEADLVERMNDRRASKGQQAVSETVSPRASVTAPVIQTFAAPKAGVSSSKAPPPVGPYPHAKRVGDFLFLSGVGPRRPGTSEIPGVMFDVRGSVSGHDVVLQTESVFHNISVILEEAGSSLEDVVDVQVYLTDMKRDFKAFNGVYAKYFGYEGGPSPTRTTVEVTALPTPICVELKVTAYVPKAKA
ncbi:MAG: Rid family hydrolase [Bdellovibrionales bacterium]|jgi:2-aminophenol/2-amino-5-chlorophenol 1,6-dioxygenase alpha subunit|nr:Rid family hydrolase [Bdellovibrionales bacterium]